MKKILLLIVWLSAILPANSQDRSVKIIVKDSNSGRSISGANVYIDKLEKVFGTDSNGELDLIVPPEGYSIAISYVGYESQLVKVENDKTRIRVMLVSMGTDLEEVIISSVRADNNVKSTDIGKDVLQLESIRDLPPLAGEIDIIKSMVLLPGVSTVGEASSGLNVRGGGFDQNLVLLGGGVLYDID